MLSIIVTCVMIVMECQHRHQMHSVSAPHLPKDHQRWWVRAERMFQTWQLIFTWQSLNDSTAAAESIQTGSWHHSHYLGSFHPSVFSNCMCFWGIVWAGAKSQHALHWVVSRVQNTQLTSVGNQRLFKMVMISIFYDNSNSNNTILKEGCLLYETTENYHPNLKPPDSEQLIV